jgi:hygromycin-B 7''-O-kinase
MTSRLALPPAESEEDFDDLTDEDLRPGVAALCRDLGVGDLGVGGSDVVRFPGGSLPVYAVGAAVLKLFPPVHLDEFPVEAGVLAAVEGRLPVPTPGVRAVGERDDWGYVLMDRLRGESLETAWNGLGAEGRDSIATQLGEALAALHAVPVPEIDDWWPEDWDDFVYTQRAMCVARHRGLGLAPEWLAKVEPFLDGVDLPDGEPVLLHTEIMRQHLLVAPGDDGWRLTGLLDFEPAVRGAREYEFVGLGCSVAEGDARFLGRALRAYGYADPDEAFRRRMMAWTLLHFYSNVRKYLDRLPQPEEPTFESLAERWYATE